MGGGGGGAELFPCLYPPTHHKTIDWQPDLATRSRVLGQNFKFMWFSFFYTVCSTGIDE